MNEVLDKPGADPVEGVDRPAWIPFNIVADWDPSPYAYQTEEELMSQGALHDLLMTYISQVMPNHLDRFGFELWKDLFLLYRSTKGLKKRIGPDLLVAEQSLEFSAGSWDLDEMPVPQFIGEITSPSSRHQDLEFKRKLYHKLGVSRYMVIDGHDDKGKVSGEIAVHIWLNGKKQSPDDKGFVDVPELQIKVKPLDTELVFYHRETAKPLLDMKTAEQKIEALENELSKLKKE